MADPALATKAPEIDATEHEETIIPGDTPAQTGASLGEHCSSDRPVSLGAAPSGTISKINDVEVYISKPSDYPHLSSKLLLFLSSGTGLHSVNNQLQADKFAKEGFLVIMPDMFEGDPAPNSSSTVEESNPSLIEQIKVRAAEAAKSFLLDMWLARHTPEKILPILHKVIDGAKDEFADAVASGDGIYGVGYCTGAKYVLLLASEQPNKVAQGQKPSDEEAGVVGTGPYLRAGAIAHGTLVTQDDFEGLKSPMLLVCVENDQLFPDEVRKAGEELCKSKKLEYQLEIYPGVPHGFATEGEYEDPKIKTAQTQAFSQMLEWLKNH